MKSFGLAAAFAATAFSGAYAADLGTQAPPPPPPAATSGFDYAFGGKLMSDYMSRGVTQSNHAPSVTAYGELRYNFGDTQLYAGTQFWSIKLPTTPSAEVDIYGGLRQTWGAFSVDVGAIGYLYPDNTTQYFTTALATCININTCGGVATTPKDPSWVEIYAKPAWTVNSFLTLGANFYYSPSWTNTGAKEWYLSGTAKVNLPSNFSISGEFGHEDLGTPTYIPGPNPSYVSYEAWNLGLSYAFKVFTLDLRYYGTNINKANCYFDTSDPAGNPGMGKTPGTSKWCGSAVVATLSADLTSANLK